MVILRLGLLIVSILHLLCPSALGMVTYGIDSQSICSGSLVLGYEDDHYNVNILTLRGRRNGYRNIKRGFPQIRRNTISSVEVDGNCCWELYPRRSFQGEHRVVFPEEGLTYTDFQPGSIRNIECPY